MEKTEAFQIKRCEEYIQENLENPLHLPEIAAWCGYNPSYLSRKFKKEKGESLKNYIVRQKLFRAASYLSDSNKSLVQISNQLCFASQSHFQTVFKRYYHVTPLMYRREARNG